MNRPKNMNSVTKEEFNIFLSDKKDILYFTKFMIGIYEKSEIQWYKNNTGMLVAEKVCDLTGEDGFREIYRINMDY